ncbi:MULTISPECIES: copper chaperone CopZ [Sutcliffiella]|uniref:Copper chaperone CopZ n=1 Tax=Sutcliffiella cohnii TaxID=33932 RepID=A0A223KXG7_9BACI|nr:MULTISPECIES: copper chaperone CopZ [Sutcliffiella]AST94113.1 copper resistance protein CopZ [Sutcliffiella cohnii]MED4017354.1 copper chaperone CopZ [Sutcliffiella cohnii]WBL15326.1 copper chaperone CopZ [Sutcliffiella sp. NC1]
MEQVTLNVGGMSCGHCVKAVEGSVGTLDGVQTVQVDLSAGKVTVDFDGSKVSVNKIKEVIDEEGYDVE